MRMKMPALALVVMLVASQPAFGHHSFAPFDLAREITLVGTIKEVQFTSPHVWLQVLVPNGRRGQTEWSIEAGAPGMLLRTGWKSTTLKAGDPVTIVTHPARSGAPSGSLVRVTLADGRVFGPGGPPPPQPSRK
jgi:uncharacterized protein DUF6152